MVPWCTRKKATLPTYGSTTILKTWASTCFVRSGTAWNSSPSVVSLFTNGGGLPSVALGARRERISRNCGMPAPVFAEVKQTGTRCPSRSAFSNGACSCSGFRSSPCSR